MKAGLKPAFILLSSLKYYLYFAELSFPRRRESRQVYVFTGVGWIPAYAGMMKLYAFNNISKNSLLLLFSGNIFREYRSPAS